MTEYPIDINEAHLWLRDEANLLQGTGVSLADVSVSLLNVPSAKADFDSEDMIGRISIWATGEIDLEVLRRSDGGFLFFRHEDVRSLQTSTLDNAYREFIDSMRCDNS